MWSINHNNNIQTNDETDALVIADIVQRGVGTSNQIIIIEVKYIILYSFWNLWSKVCVHPWLQPIVKLLVYDTIKYHMSVRPYFVIKNILIQWINKNYVAVINILTMMR